MLGCRRFKQTGSPTMGWTQRLVGSALLCVATIGCFGPDSAYHWSECQDPVAILDVSGDVTGFVTCSDGSMNRVVTVDINLSPYEEELVENPDSCGWGYSGCTTHEDCGPSSGSFCVLSQDGEYSYCECRTLCANDDECGENSACFPPELGVDWAAYPRCHNIRCRIGSDCDSGECGVSYHYDDGVRLSLFCRAESDQCRVDSDCEVGQCIEGGCT